VTRFFYDELGTEKEARDGPPRGKRGIQGFVKMSEEEKKRNRAKGNCCRWWNQRKDWYEWRGGCSLTERVETISLMKDPRRGSYVENVIGRGKKKEAVKAIAVQRNLWKSHWV